MKLERIIITKKYKKKDIIMTADIDINKDLLNAYSELYSFGDFKLETGFIYMTNVEGQFKVNSWILGNKFIEFISSNKSGCINSIQIELGNEFKKSDIDIEFVDDKDNRINMKQLFLLDISINKYEDNTVRIIHSYDNKNVYLDLDIKCGWLMIIK